MWLARGKTSERSRTTSRTAPSEWMMNLAVRLRLLLGRAAPFEIEPARQLHLLRHVPARLLDEGRDVALFHVAGHGLPPARAIVLDARAAIRELHVGQFAERHAQAVAIGEEQIAHALRIAPRLVGEHDGELVNAVAAHHLRDIRALEGGLHGVEHFERAEAELRQPLRPQAHREDRRAGGRLDLHVGVALRRLQLRRHELRGLVELVEVVAEDVDHHLRVFAGERLADAIAEKGQHLALDARKIGEHLAQRGLRFHLLRGRGAGLQLDVKFALVRPPRVLARLRRGRPAARRWRCARSPASGRRGASRCAAFPRATSPGWPSSR